MRFHSWPAIVVIAGLVCAACDRSPTSPPAGDRALMKIQNAAVSWRPLFPGLRYAVSFELAESGGVDAVVNGVVIDFNAQNWSDRATFQVSEVFEASQISAFGTLSSRTLGWTSSSTYLAASITVSWTDRSGAEGTTTRVVSLW